MPAEVVSYPVRPSVRHVDAAVVMAGVEVAWFALHVALYVLCVGRLESKMLEGVFLALTDFFLWQAVGFFSLAVFLAIRRPAWASMALGGYLVLSTLVLLAFSRDGLLLLRLVLLLGWMLCAIGAVRHVLARLVGPSGAAWGIAAASLYAAMIPISLCLGLLHAIAPWIVAVLAVATAVPGAICWFRQWPEVTRGVRDGLNRLKVFDFLILEVIWFFLAVTFVNASTSATLSDAPRVHLPYIHQVIADQGLSHQYACWHRLQLMAVQTCCATVAAVGTDLAGTWYSSLALVALTWLIAEEVFRRSRDLRLAIFAGAVVLSCPLLLRVATSLQIDHVLTLLCCAGFIVLFRALEQSSLRGVLLSAALMGAMVQVKYTGLVFALVWACFLTVELIRRRGWLGGLRWSIAAGSLFLAVGVPWYVYVFLGTGNPFFPYLHHWFPSPYWIDGYTLQEVFERKFRLDPGIMPLLSFPWTATYHTHLFVEGFDGILGIWILGLAPCWFLAWPRQTVRYWDMVIVGVALVAGIVAYTPYPRYWMAAYPLLAAACVLAAGSLVRSVPWRPAGRLPSWLFAGGLVGVLLLPVPLACYRLTWAWDEYAKLSTTEERLENRFKGFKAVERLNAILRPNEGVLCTDFEGVYTIRGRAYAFPFRYSEQYGSSRRIYRIDDVDAFTAYCRRYGICYWLINHSPAMVPSADSEIAELGIPTRYWTDARIVAASGTVVVYDVGSPEETLRRDVERRLWPVGLDGESRVWSPDAPCRDWVKIDGDVTFQADRSSIVLVGSGCVAHRLPLESAGTLCRIELDLWSGAASETRIETTWYGHRGEVLEKTTSIVSGESDYRADVYTTVPPGAKQGWVQVSEKQGMAIRLKGAAVCVLNPPESADHERSAKSEIP